MHQCNARVEVDLEDASDGDAQRIGAALEPLRPSMVETLSEGFVEVRVAVAAETLMVATISAVFGVWTATGGDPVAVDVTREATPGTEAS